MSDIASISDSSINNPYSVGRPVRNSDMFFGRKDIFESVLEKLKGQDRANGIVLYGQSRIGKTSILHHMIKRLEADYYCILVDLQKFTLNTLNDFLWELAYDILSVLHENYQIKTEILLDRTIFMENPRRSFEDVFLRQLWPLIDDKHVLLMIDEAARLQEENMKSDIQYMRYLMQNHKQLNFLFSFRNSLEEMTEEYASVFNPLLYIKASFLDQDETKKLITQPIRNYYSIDSAAQEKIFDMTSGHPYYTQLLCLCLFDRWQKRGATLGEHIGTQHVEEILNDAVTLGSMPLKQAWLESTIKEKVIIIGMVSAMDGNNHPVRVEDIERAWKTAYDDVPSKDTVRSLKRLIDQDIIFGQDQYRFTVDLLRIWVQKNNSLETVKGETEERERRDSEHQTRNVSRRSLVIAGSVLAIGAITGGTYLGLIYHPSITSQRIASLPLKTTLQICSEHAEAVYAIAWSPDGKSLASGSLDKTIRVRDISLSTSTFPIKSTNSRITVHNHSNTIYAIAWSPDGKRIASGGDDWVMSIWDAVSGDRMHPYTGHTGTIYAVSWSPDGTSVISGSADWTVRTWDITSPANTPKIYSGHREIVYSAKWAPDDRRIVSGGADQTIEVWDADSDETYLAYFGHQISVYALAWSPDSKRIVSGGNDMIVKVWDASSGKRVLSCKGHAGSVYAVAWSPDGKYIASGSEDKTVKVWHAFSGQEYLTYTGHMDAVTDVAWSPDGKILASGSEDKTVQVWKASN